MEHVRVSEIKSENNEGIVAPETSDTSLKTGDRGRVNIKTKRKRSADVAQTNEDEPMCCVCLENLGPRAQRNPKARPKNFALLDCDHVLCTDDAKAWQKQKQSEGVGKDCGISCPMCRVVTSWFWSSPSYAKGDARKRLIESMEGRLAQLPCCYGSSKRCKSRGRHYCPYLHTVYRPPPPPDPTMWAWSSGWEHKLQNKGK
jgi:hypothetical protein